jgi:hypothetical protein
VTNKARHVDLLVRPDVREVHRDDHDHPDSPKEHVVTTLEALVLLEKRALD